MSKTPSFGKKGTFHSLARPSTRIETRIEDYLSYLDSGNIKEFNTLQTFRNNLRETNLPEEEKQFLHENISAIQTYIAKEVYKELVEYDFSSKLTSMGGKSAKHGRRKLNKKRGLTRRKK